MTHPERVDQYLEHISQAIERINRYLIPLGSIKIFLANEQIQDAIVRNIEIIGEAANRIQNACRNS